MRLTLPQLAYGLRGLSAYSLPIAGVLPTGTPRKIPQLKFGRDSVRDWLVAFAYAFAILALAILLGP